MAALSPPVRLERWVPTLRQPADLYLAYLGIAEDLSAVAGQSGAADLAVLRVPFGP